VTFVVDVSSSSVSHNGRHWFFFNAPEGIISSLGKMTILSCVTALSLCLSVRLLEMPFWTDADTSSDSLLRCVDLCSYRRVLYDKYCNYNLVLAEYTSFPTRVGRLCLSTLLLRLGRLCCAPRSTFLYKKPSSLYPYACLVVKHLVSPFHDQDSTVDESRKSCHLPSY